MIFGIRTQSTQESRRRTKNMAFPDPEELEGQVLEFCFQLHLKTVKYFTAGQ